MFRRVSYLLILLLALATFGCQQTAEPLENPEVQVIEVTREVEVIREVEVPVEVTRIVEVKAESVTGKIEEAGIPTDQLFPVVVDSFASDITDRSYRLTVVLPMSYNLDDGRDYPVIYVTDGDFYAIPLAMSAGQIGMDGDIPEVIVVGFDFGVSEIEEWYGLRWDNMVRDGRDTYLQFLIEDLIPYVESQYRIKPDARTLVGHSSGGKFALHAMLNAPGTFENVIASSPADAFSMRSQAKTFANDQAGTTVNLFISLAGEDDMAMKSGAEKFIDALDSTDSEFVSYELVTLDNETHLSVRPRAFSDGLRWVFAK